MDYVEIEVKATNKAGQSETVHAEYQTSATNPHEAAREVIDHVIKRVGNERMREIDPGV